MLYSVKQSRKKIATKQNNTQPLRYAVKLCLHSAL